ncbi:MAG TPA: MbcA/ParS/Xre antitoxin family protein [Xanthobacteraceae bacterium]|nr:MbcA/ParS/Xre antitoxin family protein [Xanthobacteraceae bacterium]
MLRPVAARSATVEGAVLTKALVRAAERLGLSNKAAGRVIGVSEATMSRIGSGTYVLARGDKPFELATLLIRLFRSLDAIVGGDETVARAWLKAENSALGGRPIEKIQTVSGLVDVIAYLDARRAVV